MDFLNFRKKGPMEKTVSRVVAGVIVVVTLLHFCLFKYHRPT